MDVKRIIDALCELSKGYISHYVQYDSCREPAHVPDFIMQCHWGCDYAHMYEKFGYYREKFGLGWAIPFYNELDTCNSDQFAEWLEEYAEILRTVRVLKKHGKAYVCSDDIEHFSIYCEAIGLDVRGGIVDEDGDMMFYLEK